MGQFGRPLFIHTGVKLSIFLPHFSTQKNIIQFTNDKKKKKIRWTTALRKIPCHLCSYTVSSTGSF